MLKYWNSIDAFKTQLKLTENCPRYTFYDGPPFATGTPHYGNLLAGTIKDICTRYATQTGHYVERRFGWDCHGLPVEYEVDKKLNLRTQKEHLDFGIKNYNNECRKIVMKYSGLWKDIVERFGRWIDFDNGYKTLDLSYMESVWWVFKELYNKGLVYRSSRVMPFSTGCSTVLSNFEANSNYKENVPDPSIVISFPVLNKHGVKILSWTTTPWTLPSNLALTVNPNLEYVIFEDPKTNEHYVCGKSHIEGVKKMLNISKDTKLKILESIKGSEMIGWEYEPLYPYFEEYKKSGCFRVIGGEFVTEDVGTGVVHTAPGFGDNDFKACCKAGIIRPDSPPCPINDSGKFIDPVVDYKGLYIKDADSLIKAHLKQAKRLIAASTIHHNYPFCWRSDTPLIYKAVHAWFINVTSIKSDLLKNNMKSRWIPQNIQEKRFQNWLADARDWCFSRNRYWGNPIPLWVSDDYKEVVPIGSIKELTELAGLKSPITDLHRDYIDQITIPSKMGKGMLHRVPEVFDCWFESGSMPFCQCHYPFEVTEEQLKKRFPADFVAEGLDQTRGWFYTLLVISTALRNSNPYKNLIAHGLILAEDGKKMSKHLHNYTDPVSLANKTGADAIRLYMMNSPVVKAEALNFSNKGVENIVKTVLLPWYNAYRFLIQNITRWEMKTGNKFEYNDKIQEKIKNKSANIMDKWIIGMTQDLMKFVQIEMENYRLYTVVPKILKFMDQLTNEYVRFNRSRIKGDTSLEDWSLALNILFNVMINTTVLMSSYAPFTSEIIYHNLKHGIPQGSSYLAESVHFLRLPETDESLIDKKIETQVAKMQSIILLGRTIRDRKKLPVKQPLTTLTIISKDDKAHELMKSLEKYISSELNVMSIKYDTDESKFVYYKPNSSSNIKRTNKEEFAENNKKTSGGKKQKRSQNESLNNTQNELNNEESKMVPIFYDKYLNDPKCGCGSNSEACIIINTEITEDLKKLRAARELSNHIQLTRKDASINVEDFINIYYSIDGEEMKKIIYENLTSIKKTLKTPLVDIKYMPNIMDMLYKDQYTTKINGKLQTVDYILGKSHVVFDIKMLRKKLGRVRMTEINKAIKEIIKRPHEEVKKELENGELKMKLENKEIKLENGKDVFVDIEKYINARK